VFDVYVIPDEETEGVFCIQAFRSRPADFIQWLMERTRRCTILVTFAGINPPFAEMLDVPRSSIRVLG